MYLFSLYHYVLRTLKCCCFKVNFGLFMYRNKGFAKTWKEHGPKRDPSKPTWKIETRNRNKTSKKWLCTIGLCIILSILKYLRQGNSPVTSPWVFPTAAMTSHCAMSNFLYNRCKWKRDNIYLLFALQWKNVFTREIPYFPYL